MNSVSVPNTVHEAEIDRIMKVYGSSLLRMCFLYLRDASLAEDAVQDTFVKAFRNLTQFRGESDEKTWLMRIAINTCKDYHRTAWLRFVDRRVSLDNLPEPYGDMDAMDDTVLSEVMRLPAKYKEVILLRYYQEMKVSDIAGALCVPEATVASRLNRARAKLRTKLGRWYFDA